MAKTGIAYLRAAAYRMAVVGVAAQPDDPRTPRSQTGRR
jgi:hypothetical protein